MDKIDQLKIEIFDILERQSMLARENQNLEQLKSKKGTELDAARAEAGRKAQSPNSSPPQGEN